MIAHASGHIAVAQGFMDDIERVFLFPLMSLLIGLAMVYFLWGLFIFVTNASNEMGRATGRRHMIWGILGLVIIVSAYAILQIATGTFGITTP